jgi:SseB protein C-terminal domain/SseB protein N-terminal domain
MAEGFEPENAVETLMAEARAGHTPMDTFLRALLTSFVFLAPSEDSTETELQLEAYEGPDGHLYAPVFTSPQRLARFVGHDRGASVQLATLAETWPESLALVINPGDAVELVLPGHDLLKLAAGEEDSPQTTVGPGTSIMLGEPAEEPEDVLAAVAEAAAGRPEVKAAYRAQMYIDRPGEEPQLAIGLLLDGPGGAALEDEIGNAATAAGADAVVVVPIHPEAEEDPVAGYMLERIEPFYRRDPSNSG